MQARQNHSDSLLPSSLTHVTDQKTGGLGKGNHSCEALLLLLAQMPKQMEGQGSSAERLQISSAGGE